MLACRKGNVSRSLACITEADAARWATEFATVSFGDPLLASAVALLLLPQMPPGVQVSLFSLRSILLSQARSLSEWTCRVVGMPAWHSTALGRRAYIWFLAAPPLRLAVLA